MEHGGVSDFGFLAGAGFGFLALAWNRFHVAVICGFLAGLDSMDFCRVRTASRISVCCCWMFSTDLCRASNSFLVAYVDCSCFNGALGG